MSPTIRPCINTPQIDLDELIQAFKKQRTATNYLNRDSPRGPPESSLGGGSGEIEAGDSMMSPGKGPAPRPRGAENEGISDVGFEQDRYQIEQEGQPLFAPEEAELLTAYMVESQQAFSLMSVVDIQHGEGTVRPVLSAGSVAGDTCFLFKIDTPVRRQSAPQSVVKVFCLVSEG